VIEGQRINPFTFRQRKMREQVEKRWAALLVALP